MNEYVGLCVALVSAGCFLFAVTFEKKSIGNVVLSVLGLGLCVLVVFASIFSGASTFLAWISIATCVLGPIIWFVKMRR